MKTKILIFIVAIFLIGIVSAQQQSIGPFKQNSIIELPQICPGSSYCKIFNVQSPDMSYALGGVDMSTTDNLYYNYSFSNSTLLGRYIVNGHCDVDGTDTGWAYDFEITPSGSIGITSGSGLSFIGSLIVMLIVALVFLFVGLSMKNIAAKVSFISFSVIVFIMTILFTVVSAQQNLYGFPGLVTGSETFWFIIKILIGIGIFSLFIIIGLVMKKAWKIKRGYLDE